MVLIKENQFINVISWLLLIPRVFLAEIPPNWLRQTSFRSFVPATPLQSPTMQPPSPSSLLSLPLLASLLSLLPSPCAPDLLITSSPTSSSSLEAAASSFDSSRDAFEADSSFDGVEERSFDDFFSQQDNFFGDEFIPSAQPLVSEDNFRFGPGTPWGGHHGPKHQQQQSQNERFFFTFPSRRRRPPPPQRDKFFVGDQSQCTTGSCEFFLICWMSGGIVEGDCGGFLMSCCNRPSKVGYGVIAQQDNFAHPDVN